MSNRLSNKKALVTGAGQGIGKETVIQFANEGAKVFATDKNEKALEFFNDKSNIIPLKLDVTNYSEIKELVEITGSVDIIFNCAGIVHEGTILDCNLEDWDITLDVNVKSMFQIIKTYIPLMLKENSGSIINMSSLASSTLGVPNRFVYSVSKAAVIGLTKSIAKDFVEKNIRCNAICPATIETPSLQDRINKSENPNEEKKKFIARQPMKRIGKPEEIAKLAVYLASDESSYTTGVAHIIDGGMAI